MSRVIDPRTRRVARLELGQDDAYIERDGGGNISFTDGVSGTQTVGDLIGGGGGGPTVLREALAADRTLLKVELQNNDVFFLTSSVVAGSAALITANPGPWDLTGKTYLATEDDFNGVIDVDLSAHLVDPANVFTTDLQMALQSEPWGNPEYMITSDDPGPDQLTLGFVGGTQIRAVTPSVGAGQDANTVLGFPTTYQTTVPPVGLTLSAMDLADDGRQVALVVASGEEMSITVPSVGSIGQLGPGTYGQAYIFFWDNTAGTWILK